MSVHGKTKGLLWIGGMVVLAFFFAKLLPYLARHVPWSFEEKIANHFVIIPSTSHCSEANGKEVLNKVTQRLYPVFPHDQNFSIQVKVISGLTENAFASFGGHLYVYDRLLQKMESPEELAAVLAHEIEHVSKRHLMQALFDHSLALGLRFLFLGGDGGGDLAETLLKLGFSRGQEAQADRGALKRLSIAHVSTQGFQSFFDRLSKESSVPEFLSDHPASKDRAELAKDAKGTSTSPLLSNEEWKTLKAICGSKSI